VDKKKIRERIIRATWKERGIKLWNPETHGKGIPLIIPAEQEATSIATLISPGDNLEFQLFCATGRGRPFNYIVCDGIVVETWGEHESPRFLIDRIDD
jgi:hypothetical protein